MPTACIQHPRARAALESERLVVSFVDEGGRNIRREIPLFDLERLILSESASITTPALAELLRREIPVCLIDFRGHYLGSFQPAHPDHGAARLLQYQRTLDPEFALKIARKVIIAKIYNQRRMLQRIVASRRTAKIPVADSVPTAIDLMDKAMFSAGHAETLDSLRGYEGLASAKYFPAWATLLPTAFPFERRSTRPPLNPVNAVLSFISTLIYNEVHAHLNARGLDPALGLLHTTENGRWSLALDLMEPFRPIVAEALTLDLFSHRMLSHTHFEPVKGGTYLNRDGRARLLIQYEKRMERQFMSEHVEHRTTLRQQIENLATDFKSALDSPESFEPFLMN